MPQTTSENQKSGWVYVLWGAGVLLVIGLIVAMIGVAGEKASQTVVVIPPTPVPTNTLVPTNTTPSVAPTEGEEAVKPTEAEEAYKLDDTDWVVTELNDTPYSSLDLEKAGLSLKFIGKTTLSGYDGCGNYKTAYKENPEKGSLYIDPEILMEVVTPTPDENGNVDNGSYCTGLNDEAKKARVEFLEKLSNITKYEVSGTNLKLYDQAGTLVLTARKTS